MPFNIMDGAICKWHTTKYTKYILANSAKNATPTSNIEGAWYRSLYSVRVRVPLNLTLATLILVNLMLVNLMLVNLTLVNLMLVK